MKKPDNELDHWNLQKSKYFLKNNIRDESTVTAVSLGQQQDVMMRKVLFDHNRKVASALPPETVPSGGPQRMNTMERLLHEMLPLVKAEKGQLESLGKGKMPPASKNKRRVT
jgi:hypothetical protein